MVDIMSLSQEEKITLDRNAFKALASNTRVNILKALEANQRTVSELARELEMNKATMYQHLEQLRQAGLVKRMDGPERLKTVKSGPHQAPVPGPPRKWVYYKLTFKGKNVVNPGKVRFAVMLTVFAVIGIAVVLLLFANVMFINPPGPTYSADVTPPAIEMWNAKSTSATDTSYRFDVEIYDIPTIDRERVSGLDTNGIQFYYGFADRERGTTPNIQDWTEVDHTSSGNIFTVRIRDLDMTDKGGMYIYLKVEAKDMKGNQNESMMSVYIVKHTEPDLMFGDNGLFGNDNGLFGDDGVYILGGGGGVRTNYEVGVQVVNTGDEDADPFKIGVYTTDVDLNDDGKIDKGGMYVNYLLMELYVDGLKVDEVKNLTDTVDITIMKDLVAPDKGGMYIVIDVEDEVKEQDEANNILKVTAPPEMIEDIQRYCEGGNSPKGTDSEMGTAPGFEAIILVVAATIAIMFRYRKLRSDLD